LVTSIARSATAGPSEVAWVRLREYLHIPESTPDSVYAVTDPSVCEAAGNAFSLTRGNAPTDGRSVIVVKAGDAYVVKDPDDRAGEWALVMVFDQQFNRLAGFLD
jgi:hypothetical protein